MGTEQDARLNVVVHLNHDRSVQRVCVYFYSPELNIELDYDAIYNVSYWLDDEAGKEYDEVVPTFTIKSEGA